MNSIRTRADLGLLVVRLATGPMGIEFVHMLFGASVALALAGQMSADAMMGRKNTVP